MIDMLLQYIHPIEIIKYKGKFYINRAWILNNLIKYYDIELDGYIIEKEDINLDKVQKLDGKIKCNNFFIYGTSFGSFISHIYIYLRKINELKNKKKVFFIHYPAGFIGIILTFFLKKEKLIIWVKSDLISQFIYNGNKFTKYIRFILKPFVYEIYEGLSRIIFKNNLIFYTSNIIINKKNHINQIELISCSEFNTDKSLIKKNFTKKIIFIGGEHNQKGLNVLLKALNNVDLDLELNIVGLDNFSRKENIILAKNLNIKFFGKIHERNYFYKILAKSDLLIMPSFGEKQGKVQLEAMSVGVVPICSDGGGTYRTITNYYNGLLFKEGDYIKLARHIESLYGNPDIYINIKNNGLDYISDLSLKKQISKMVKIIDNFYFLNK